MKKIILITIIILLAGGVGYYIYRDLNVRSSVSNTVGNLVPDKKTEESTPGVDVATTTAITTKMPDLDRLIKVTTNIPEASKKSAIQKIEELVVALKKDPKLISHWLDLASYRRIIGDYDGAGEIWKYLTVVRPLDNVSFLNLGDLYAFYIKDNVMAEKYFLKALELQPDYIAGYLTVSDFYNEVYTEKSAQAKKILQDGLQKNPNDINLQSALKKLQ